MNLFDNDSFCRQALPFIKSEYFTGVYRNVYELFVEYIKRYNRLPKITSLKIDAENLPDDIFDSSIKLLDHLDKDKSDGVDEEWLLNRTEKWCKDRAVYLAIMDSISIIDGKEKSKYNLDAIPDILQKALAVSFDKTVGHDYIEDSLKRWDKFHEPEDKIEFGLDLFNKITRDGITRKSLTIFMGGTGGGKSLVMCDYASYLLTTGRNVLYITLEMAEERIAERIDANCLDIPIDQLHNISRDDFNRKVSKIHEKSRGRLMIKEYPTASAHAGHFRALLNELELKKKFKPDVIFIDYINICASSRIKGAASVNSYTLVKSIAEEIRGLSMEFNVPIISATQTNRMGYGDSDVEITNISESFGLAATCDLALAIIVNEELDELGQIMFKQLKNRYNDVSINRRFLIGIDRSKMKLYDLEDTAQTLIETNPPKENTKDFSGFKV